MKLIFSAASLPLSKMLSLIVPKNRITAQSPLMRSRNYRKTFPTRVQFRLKLVSQSGRAKPWCCFGTGLLLCTVTASRTIAPLWKGAVVRVLR